MFNHVVKDKTRVNMHEVLLVVVPRPHFHGLAERNDFDGLFFVAFHVRRTHPGLELKSVTRFLLTNSPRSGIKE